jgi:hypothetical protein
MERVRALGARCLFETADCRFLPGWWGVGCSGMGCPEGGEAAVDRVRPLQGLRKGGALVASPWGDSRRVGNGDAGRHRRGCAGGRGCILKA